MNIILWLLQIVLAFFCVSGAVWRFLNYEQASKDVASMAALSYGVWNAIGAFEILCALGLILPGLLKLHSSIIGIAALALSLELFLISILHVKYFGFQLAATNPAVWSFGLCIVAAIIAYSRLK